MTDTIAKCINESNKIPCVLMITGKSCPPCDRIKPVYNDFRKNKKSIAFLEPIVFEDEPNLVEKLGFKVKSFPVFAGYVDGECIEHFVGADNNQLKSLIDLMTTEAAAKKHASKDSRNRV